MFGVTQPHVSFQYHLFIIMTIIVSVCSRCQTHLHRANYFHTISTRHSIPPCYCVAPLNVDNITAYLCNYETSSNRHTHTHTKHHYHISKIKIFTLRRHFILWTNGNGQRKVHDNKNYLDICCAIIRMEMEKRSSKMRNLYLSTCV